MIRIAKFFLFLFLLLFAIFYLVVTKIQPDTQKIVLGVAAALAAIAMIVDMFGWKRAASIMLLAVPLGATGCVGMPKLFDPKVIEALAKDRASWEVEIQSNFGTIKYRRWGEGGFPTNSGSITVSPETELKVIRGRK